MEADEVPYDDNAHTGCYIFEPGETQEEDIDPRPQKRRKPNQTALPPRQEEEYTWPALLGGQETLVAANLRKSAFELLWSQEQAKIDEVVNQVDEVLVDQILDHVHRKREKASPRQQSGLQTVLLASGLASNPQQDLHKIWQRRTEDDRDEQHEILVPLRPMHCPNLQIALKNLIRLSLSQSRAGMDEYSSFLAEHKPLVPLNFDLELLQRYVERKGIERVLISLMDVEAFDTSVLSELISTFHSWSDRIPAILCVGISTTIELFESRFSRSTVSLLDAQVFESSHSSSSLKAEDPLFRIYHKVQHDREARVFLGPAIFSTLAELAQDQSTTTETFTRAIKHAYMSHFFANPLSVLAAQPTDTEAVWTPAFCQAVRNTSSFRRHCETLLDGDKPQRHAARLLLTSDETLCADTQNAVEAGREQLRSSLVAASTLHDIYHRLLKLGRLTMWELELRLLTSPPNLMQSEVAADIEDAIRADASALDSVTSALDSSTAGFHLEDLCQYRSSTGDAVSSDDPATSLDADGFMTLLHNYLASRTASSSTSNAIPADPFNVFASEVYTLAHKSPLSSTIHPRARSALERALTRPTDYLGCPCCVPAKSGAMDERARLPPTSLLLNMLNEAGAIANVQDLWDAFRDTLAQSAERQGDGDETGKEDEGNDGDEDGRERDSAASGANREERQTLALFYRALADLRYLGLIRPSKRKPGVECIAKTAWMGL